MHHSGQNSVLLSVFWHFMLVKNNRRLNNFAPEGVFDATNESFTVSCCVTVIIKILMEVELLVPSYGYATIPPCQEYTQEVCSGFFELPLFPGNG